MQLQLCKSYMTSWQHICGNAMGGEALGKSVNTTSEAKI